MINSVYNYYLDMYHGKKYSGRTTSNKPQDLKRLCVSIANNNQNSFLYKINISDTSCKYAIDLKECGLSLKALTSELSTDNPAYVMQKYKAFSDNEDIVTAQFLGNSSTDQNNTSTSDISVRVEQLATTQINTGYVLKDEELDFASGKHNFTIDIGSSSYNLQFTVRENDRNQNVLNRVANLINRNPIGIMASVVHNSEGSALRLESNSTGVVGTTPYIFTINFDDDTDAYALGIDYVSQYPANSSYYINGEHFTATNNSVSYNNMYALNFNKTCELSVNISTSYDSDSILTNIHSLVNNFNNSMTLAKGSGDYVSSSSLLEKNLKEIAKTSINSLTEYGFEFDDNNVVALDDDKLKSYLDSDICNDILNTVNLFKDKLAKSADDLIIDPLNFMNKTLISYNNPSKPYFCTYATSLYAGMLFNYYL